ncbi:MAG: CAP domain-containing protein [Chloroflexota bacterium]|nr:CAP domain-containing protein [Chloroflexota bacterium]
MGKKACYLIGLLIVILLSACGSQQGQQGSHPAQSFAGSTPGATQPPLLPVSIVINAHKSAATASPTPVATPGAHTNIPALAAPTAIQRTGVGPAPYGSPPPLTSEEIQLTQQLFLLMNRDRAVRGLPPFVWNATLSGGARLHSWNMVHCGFSHTCPNGENQCTRIANEGFAGYSDCGENIALAGPYPTAWQGVYKIQEGMINEPPTGWHRIQLTSTRLHRVGVGVFVDSKGWVWFTEDLVS